MGVLKNDVGRPSNKTIRTRFVLKLIVLILVVALAFIIGYKFSGNNEEVKTNEKTAKEESSKYDDFDFVKSKTAVIPYEGKQSYEDIEVRIVGNNIEFSKADGTLLEYDNKQKFKYITNFNVGFSDPSAFVAALTYDGKLYVLDSYTFDIENIKLKKINYDKKIKEMFVLEEFDYSDHASGKLYVLTEDNELLRLNSGWIDNSIEYKIDGKYEERTFSIGCTNGSCYYGEIYAKDNFIKLEIFDGENFVSKYVKYNNEKVEVKYLFDSYGFDYEQKLYIVTEDGDLLTAKSGLATSSVEISNESYEFIKLKKSKVKSVELIDSSTVKVTYVNGDVEEFKEVYQTYNIK